MALEQRVGKLERDVKTLKDDIRGTLHEIRDNAEAARVCPMKWRKRAWTLALLNLLLAITLFANVRYYVWGDQPSGPGTQWAAWLQALWVALAFLWLVLQMYPLALLLDEEAARPKAAAWRNMATLFRSSPGLTGVITMLVLAVAVLAALFPSTWFVALGSIVAFACVNVTLYFVRRVRQQRLISQTEGGSVRAGVVEDSSCR
jgi:hypothetical protein